MTYKLGHAKGQPSHNLLGFGKYDDQAHGGAGRGQNNNTKVTKGEGYNKPTPHSGSAIVRDGVKGHGDKKRGYQLDAHTDTHHLHGEAVGHSHDLKPMKYTSPLHSEGGKSFPGEGGANFVKGMGHSNPAKAEHHPRMGEAHTFSKGTREGAHGYGHSMANRKGDLRMSGHSKGHRLGCK